MRDESLASESGKEKRLTKSKGQKISEAKTRHGHCGSVHFKRTSEYNAWCSMRERCLNPNREDYEWYGGRGITICQEWIDSFEAFFSVVGAKPSRLH
jgi:hypothetical protein